METPYERSLSYIHSLLKFGTRPGLERVSALLDELGRPQDKLKFVHVAGTNGKGSFCTMMSEILKSAGYKTGLFTSPYVFDFCERIQINGEMISEEELCKITAEVKAAAEKIAVRDLQPTEFEFITAAALKYFADKNCDVVVLEVGLGGRLDSTNIIKTPLLSAIMSISLDHMAVLGDTVEEIAAEKSGIIKENGVTVCFSRQDERAEKIIRKTAEEKGNVYIKSSPEDIKVLSCDLRGTKAVYKDMEIFIPLIGEHQVYNAQTAVDAALALNDRNLSISPENIIDGISKARIPARTELFGKNPLTILDGAHNREGVEALISNLNKFLKGRKLTVIMGMMEDKEYAFAADEISKLAKTFTGVLPSNPRAVSPKVLAEIAEKNCSDVFICENPSEAYREIYEKAQKDDIILVCGSLYLAGDVRGEIVSLNGESR